MRRTRAAGCGYTLAGRGSFLPAYITTIGIPTFVNRTPVFNLETQLTQKVQSEFISRGNYQILSESSGVDALLNGEVTSVSIIPASFDPQQIASRYIITMSASVSLRELRGNKVLWENPGMVFRGGRGPERRECARSAAFIAINTSDPCRILITQQRNV